VFEFVVSHHDQLVLLQECQKIFFSYRKVLMPFNPFSGIWWHLQGQLQVLVSALNGMVHKHEVSCGFAFPVGVHFLL